MSSSNYNGWRMPPIVDMFMFILSACLFTNWLLIFSFWPGFSSAAFVNFLRLSTLFLSGRVEELGASDQRFLFTFWVLCPAAAVVLAVLIFLLIKNREGSKK